jgi:hypothetical protein
MGSMQDHGRLFGDICLWSVDRRFNIVVNTKRRRIDIYIYFDSVKGTKQVISVRPSAKYVWEQGIIIWIEWPRPVSEHLERKLDV